MMHDQEAGVIAKMKARGFCCSFCGRSSDQVGNIMAGSPPRTPDIQKSMARKSAFICDECVRRYYRLVTATELPNPVAAPK